MCDWHKNTTATFKPLDHAVAQALVEFASARAKRNLGASIELGGRTYTFEHISHSTSQFWRSRGLSLYFRTGQSIVRISDHWTSSRGFERSRKLNCGSVGSSRWHVLNRPGEWVACSAFGGFKYPYRMLAGVCGLNGFKRHAWA